MVHGWWCWLVVHGWWCWLVVHGTWMIPAYEPRSIALLSGVKRQHEALNTGEGRCTRATLARSAPPVPSPISPIEIA